jgi:cytochrome c biogenesis protein CcmG, thiol:disulfide interchange protein DsbE
MVWWHVGEISAWHGFSAATVGACYPGVDGCREQDDGKNLHHNYSLSIDCAMGKRNLRIEYGGSNGLSHPRCQPRLGSMMSLSPMKLSAWARRAVIPVVIITIEVLASASGRARAAPRIGEEAPPLILTTLQGSIIDLAKMRGKVVLVNYWATWCGPCRKEMPKLDAFYRRYHAKGLEIIGISIDFERDLEKARMAAGAVSYPTAVARDISDDGFGSPKGVPITWIIDADGKVRDRFIDVRDELLSGIVVPLLPH